MSFKKHKYNVSSKEYRTIDGITFDSKAEMNRYCELKLMLRVNKISNLVLQPKFLIIPKCGKERATYYVADFQYEEDGHTIVEDIKGMRTQAYNIKRKLFKWQYPSFIFREIKV